MTIELIDDLLSIRKMQVVIGYQSRTKKGTFRKGSSFYDFMDNRIGKYLDDIKDLTHGTH